MILHHYISFIVHPHGAVYKEGRTDGNSDTYMYVNLHPHLQNAYTALKAKIQRKTFMAWKVKRQYNIRLLFSVTPMFSTAFLKQQNLPTDVRRGVDCSGVDWSVQMAECFPRFPCD
jgi:hypothetical protein